MGKREKIRPWLSNFLSSWGGLSTSTFVLKNAKRGNMRRVFKWSPIQFFFLQWAAVFASIQHLCRYYKSPLSIPRGIYLPIKCQILALAWEKFWVSQHWQGGDSRCVGKLEAYVPRELQLWNYRCHWTSHTQRAMWTLRVVLLVLIILYPYELGMRCWNPFVDLNLNDF